MTQEHIASGTLPIPIVECGCCSCFHRYEWYGDCRNDGERFGSPEDAAARLGTAVVEVWTEPDGAIESFSETIYPQ